MSFKNGFSIGAWSVYPLEGRLVNDGDERRIQPKSMDVLLCLAEKAPNVVERDEILRRIWGERAQSDEPLTRCIGELRRVLGDTRSKPEYILTIPKRGYRLLHTPAGFAADRQPVVPIGSENAGDLSAVTETRRGARIGTLKNIAVGVLILLAAAFAEVIFERVLDRSATTEDAVEQEAAGNETEQKVEELLALLRNQAAASGMNLDIESEVAIENAIRAIVASGNAQKRTALSYLEKGDVATAAEMLTALAANQASAVSQTSEAATDSWREAGALFYTYDFAEAVRSYQEANRLQPGNAKTLDMLGYSLIRADRLDDAVGVFKELLALEPIAGPAERSSAHAGIGIVAKQRGNYPLAEEQLALALGIADDHGLIEQQILALNQSGMLANSQGDLDRATENLQRGLEKAEEIQSERLRGTILSGLGIIAATRQDYEEAKKLTQRALDIHKARKDLARSSDDLGNLGAITLMRGDVDAAETILLESIELKEQLNWQTSLVYDLINLGGIAVSRDEFEGAEHYLARAETIARDVGLSELVPTIVFNRGEVAYNRGDIVSACRLWREASPLLEEMGSQYVSNARARLGSGECDTAVGR